MAPNRTLVLDGPWQVAPTAQFGADRARLRFVDMPVPSHWQEHAELAAHVGRVVYVRRFAWEGAPDRRVRLMVPGVFYWSTVHLNGRVLGAHEGYFDAQVYDVTELLAADNELVIEADCPNEPDKLEKRMLTGVFSHWDCMDPAANPGGLWLAPYLVESGFAWVAENRIHTQRLSVESAFQLERLTIVSIREAAVRVVTTYHPETFEGAPQRFERTVALSAGTNFIENHHEIVEPRLWWTHDLGRPDLYRVTVRLESDQHGVLDEWSGVTGLRTIEVRDWIFHLNGVRLYIRGSNIPPTETRIARTTRELVDKDADLAVRANLNLLVVHAHVGHPLLYEAMDRRGLLAWQDMPMQWVYRREVLPEALRQARAMVRLLYNHPCVAVWCGQNEAFPIADTKDESKATVARILFGVAIYSWNRDVMATQIRRAIEEEDASRFVVRSTTELPVLRDGTDLHFYGGWYRVMGDLRAFDRFTRFLPKTLRFVSEFGAQSFPNIESAVRFMGTDLHAVDWKLMEEKYGLQRDIMDHWTPREGMKDLAAYIQATQDYQSRLNRYYIDRIRRAKYRPGGGFATFMFGEPNPGVYWSVVDHDRVPKSSYHRLADACRPIYAFAITRKDAFARGETIETQLFAVNDTREEFASATVEVLATDDEGRVIFAETYPAPLSPDCEARRVGTARVRAHVLGRVTLALTLRGCGEEFVNTYEFRIVR